MNKFSSLNGKTRWKVRFWMKFRIIERLKTILKNVRSVTISTVKKIFWRKIAEFILTFFSRKIKKTMKMTMIQITSLLEYFWLPFLACSSRYVQLWLNCCGELILQKFYCFERLSSSFWRYQLWYIQNQIHLGLKMFDLWSIFRVCIISMAFFIFH